MTHDLTDEIPRKPARKTVVIVLAAVCIVLSASLVATLALYLPAVDSIGKLKSEIAGKDNFIGSQNATIASQVQQIAALQNSLQQASAKDEEIAYLEDYVSDLLNVLYLNASATLLLNQGVQLTANESVSLWSDYLTYAEYITVQVQSNSNSTYAQVTYSSFGVDYDVKTVVGKLGEASFPVLPTSVVDIRLGNTEVSDAISATVTVVYHF